MLRREERNRIPDAFRPPCLDHIRRRTYAGIHRFDPSFYNTGTSASEKKNDLSLHHRNSFDGVWFPRMSIYGSFSIAFLASLSPPNAVAAIITVSLTEPLEPLGHFWFDGPAAIGPTASVHAVLLQSIAAAAAGREDTYRCCRRCSSAAAAETAADHRRMARCRGTGLPRRPDRSANCLRRPKTQSSGSAAAASRISSYPHQADTSMQ